MVRIVPSTGDARAALTDEIVAHARAIAAESPTSTRPSTTDLDAYLSQYYAHVPIEERAAEEVTGYRGTRWAPEGVAVRNPAFDVTPAELITGIICEKGVVLRPDRERLAALLR